jgi:aspartate racemase
MKQLAVIGVSSRHSADTCWNMLNAEAAKEYGSVLLPPVLVSCFYGQLYASKLRSGDWPVLVDTLLEEARIARSIGAEGLIILESALNPAAAVIHNRLRLTVIDLGVAVADKLKALNITRIALLGCRSSREEKMWRKSLNGVDILVPTREDQHWLRRYLNGMLVGEPMPPTWVVRSYRLISDFGKLQAQAIISTDSMLTKLLQDQELLISPVFDATTIHSWAAACWALKK